MVGPLISLECEVDKNKLTNLQSLVGGYIERIDLGMGLEAWVNEEGLLKDNYGTKFMGITIAGPFFVTRRNMASLTEKDILMLSNV